MIAVRSTRFLMTSLRPNLVKRIETVQANIHPEMVYTHFSGDFNLDHELTCRATLTAFRPKIGQQTIPVYQFEVPESTTLASRMNRSVFSPNYFTDISKIVDIKCAALTAYESEKRDYPDLRSVQFIKEHAE